MASIYDSLNKAMSFVGKLYKPKVSSVSYEREIPESPLKGDRKTKKLKDGEVQKSNKTVKLTDRTFSKYSTKDLLKILEKNHPDVSQAVWNFKIIGNSGFNINVTKLDGVSEHLTGLNLIENFLRNLDFYDTGQFEKSKNLTKVLDSMIDDVLLRGAVSAELVLDSDFKKPLYIANVDPDSVTFKVEEGRLVPYQKNKNLDIPTFFYEGLDETDKDPYGTSPFISVVHTLAFHQQVLHDIKMVIHNQGYGKYDIKVVEEVLLKNMPIPIRNNEAKKRQWLDDQLNAIISAYSKLDPDAAFVHFDSVEVDMVDSAKAILDPQKLLNVIDTQILGALKQYSTLMGRRSQGQTEQYAKLEIKIFMKSVKRVQLIIEKVISRILTKVLNINGMQGYVFFEFNDTEIRTELEKVNFEQVAISNAKNKRDNGWITQDEASKEITGKKAAGEPNWSALGVTEDPSGAQDEVTPSNPTSSDNINND